MKRGFTLMELLVVIAIIGILSAVVVTSLTGAREKAYVSQIKNDLVQMRTALEAFYAKNGRFPYMGCNVDNNGSGEGSGDGVFWSRSDSWIGSDYYSCDQWIDDEFTPFMPELPVESGGMRNWMYSSRSTSAPDGDGYQSYKLSADLVRDLGIPENPLFQHCPADCAGDPNTLCSVTVDNVDRLSIQTSGGYARCRY